MSDVAPPRRRPPRLRPAWDGAARALVALASVRRCCRYIVDRTGGAPRPAAPLLHLPRAGVVAPPRLPGAGTYRAVEAPTMTIRVLQPQGFASRDIHWLSGLLEGEGWFGLKGDGSGICSIKLNMTDRDVVERAARLFGNRRVTKRAPQPNGVKPIYYVEWTGRYAAGLMMTLYDLMGRRRQLRMRAVLVIWLRRRALFASTEPRPCSSCGTLTLPYFGSRLCLPCRRVRNAQAEQRRRDRRRGR